MSKRKENLVSVRIRRKSWERLKAIKATEGRAITEIIDRLLTSNPKK